MKTMPIPKISNICLFLTIIFISSACESSTTPGDNSGEEPAEVNFKQENGFTIRNDLSISQFASGLDLPTSLAFPPDGSNRLFVNELQTGNIWIFEDGVKIQNPFVDLETMVEGGFPVQGENGLLGITFDPNYSSNGYVYASFVVREQGVNIGKVVRMKDLNNSAQEPTIILDDVPSAPGHQIESLRFGPDDKLYVSVGDAFQEAVVQDFNTLPGKMLRLNADGSIPSDNPEPDSYTYALGFRNGFDFIFRDNGDLIITENGPNEKDEMNVVEAGANYGWPNELGGNDGSQFSQPIKVWQDIVAPAGMEFYTGSTLPQKYQNTLIQVLFGRTKSSGADPRSKRLQTVTLNGTGQSTEPVFEDLVIYNSNGEGNPTDVTQGPDGNLYFTDIFRGTIYQISAADN